MAATAQSDAPFAKQWLSAWLLSSTVHLTAIAFIVAAIDASPRGAGAPTDGEIGIVLNHDGGEAEDEAGDGAAAQDTVVEAAPPPEEPSIVVPPLTELTSPTAQPSNIQNALPQFAAPRVAQATTGGPGSYGPGDGATSVRVFGVEGRGTKFVYVFDRSTSMEGAPLAAAKQQLIASLESLESIHQFHIVFFNQRIQNFDLSGGGRRIAFATDRNKKLAMRFVGGITADGGTDRFPALRSAVAMHPDVIFFLTDADDPMSASELDEIADLNRRAGVAISTIEFGRGPGRKAKNFLHELAEATGGQYGYVDTTQLSAK